jgi:MoxR-like ATPase
MTMLEARPAPSLSDRVRRIRDGLATDLIEREVPVRLVLLAALAGEHVLLLGPPGTAKSELARRLHRAFSGARYFERPTAPSSTRC